MQHQQQQEDEKEPQNWQQQRHEEGDERKHEQAELSQMQQPVDVLYANACAAEERLKEIQRASSPSSSDLAEIRLEIRNSYEKIITLDPVYAEEKEVEQVRRLVWQIVCHSRNNSCFNTEMDSVSAILRRSFIQSYLCVCVFREREREREMYRVKNKSSTACFRSHPYVSFFSYCASSSFFLFLHFGMH
jgi:hypothetical protein